MTDDSMHLRVRIEASADTVFSALTDADTLTDWLAESAEVDLADNRYEFWGRYAPQGDRPRQQLLEAVPGASLRFTWALDPAEGSTEAGTDGSVDGGAAPPSTVDLQITSEGDDEAVLTVAHTGIPTTGSADLTALSCFWHVSLANLTAQCAGLPTMPPFDFSVPALGDALVRTVIDVGVDEVFSCLLDPTEVDKWAGGKAVIEPVVGGRYDFGWSESGPVEILELETDKVLAYSWHHATGPDTTVRFALRSSRGATYLTLMHSGFADDHVAEEFRQNWPGYLVEIKRILELGNRWEPLKV